MYSPLEQFEVASIYYKLFIFYFGQQEVNAFVNNTICFIDFSLFHIIVPLI